MPNFKPTPQQEAFYSLLCSTTSSLAVIARAGSGKTSSLKVGANLLPAAPKGEYLAIAFNKPIQETLQAEMPEHFTCKTFNGLGHGVLCRYLPGRVRLDSSKVNKLVLEYCKEHNLKLWSNIFQMVSGAKSAGLVPSDTPFGGQGLLPDDEDNWLQFCADPDVEDFEIQAAREILKQDIKASFEESLIDFNDQLYLPVCWPLGLPHFPSVFVDEAQDLNPIQHKIIERLNPERVVAVGDPHQAIYGWRGALTDSMSKLIAKYSMTETPLTVSFRCAAEIIKHAQEDCPDIEAAPWAKEGSVEFDDYTLSKQAWPKTVVLCRNNAPLFRLALHLLRRGDGFYFAGKDFAGQLAGIVSKRKARNVWGLLNELDEWGPAAIRKLEMTNRSGQAQILADKIDCLRVIGELMPKEASVEDLISKIHQLVNEKSGTVGLSTIHKAKGLEWDTVHILDEDLIPNAYVLGDDELTQQEFNLRYVARTRAKNSLKYLISGENPQEKTPKEQVHD